MTESDRTQAARELTRRHWLALVGAGSAGLAGCIGGGDGGDGDGDGDGGADTPTGTPDPADLPPVHFLTDYNNDAWQNMWENELVPAFTDETGIGVNIEYSGFSGQQEDRLGTLVQAGDPPAINTSTFDQVADLWAADQLTTVTDVVANVESEVGELIARPFEQDGDIWQVSHGYYTGVFHYRQDVYEALGLEVPTSFQGVLENARIIDESDIDIRGFGLAGKKVGKSQDELLTYLAASGIPPLGIRYEDPSAQQELVIDWPKDVVTSVLQYMKDLSQYSPDPTGIGWAESLRGWVGNQYAQQYNLNMWPAGIAAAAGVDVIAKNTGLSHTPTYEARGVGPEDVWAAAPAPDGHHVFRNADNPRGAKRFLEFLYGSDIEQTAMMYSTEPTRFLPNYSDVLGSDTYQSFDHWSQYPSHLEGLQRCQNEIVPNYYGNVEMANALDNEPVSLYVARFFFYGEMVNQVVTGTSTPEEAYEFGRQRLEQRFQEGIERFRA